MNIPDQLVISIGNSPSIKLDSNMETTGYIYLASQLEASKTNQVFPAWKVNTFWSDLKNWKKLSSHAAISLLSVALTLAVLSIAEQALALQKVGSSGPQVSNIQRCLKSLGFFQGPVTGRYASLTQSAVSRFQRANGLSVDGIVGANTQRVLQSQCQSRNSSSNVNGLLRIGSRGPSVTTLQRNLQQLGFFNGPITGYFGPETQQAVLRLQQTYGNHPDGIVGSRTQQTIRVALSNINRPNSNTSGVGGDINDNLPSALNIGDAGPGVTELQENLRQLRYFRVNPTGYFGPTTRDAVISFQQDYGLVPNGIADEPTLTAISRALNTQNPTDCSANGGICLGERSQRVSAVQQRLREWGFYNGSVNGYYGPATRDAVAQFQRYSGLNSTGFVDFQTWQALRLTNSDSTVDKPTNPRNEDRYVVVVPIRDNDTLSKVREYVPRAFAADSRLGAYVNAGQYRDRSDAERVSRMLRSRGLDARVEFF